MSSYLVILTVQKPFGSGFTQATVTRTRPVDVTAETATDLYLWAREQLPENLRDAATIFYSATPETLPAPTPAADNLVRPLGGEGS